MFAQGVRIASVTHIPIIGLQFGVKIQSGCVLSYHGQREAEEHPREGKDNNAKTDCSGPVHDQVEPPCVPSLVSPFDVLKCNCSLLGKVSDVFVELASDCNSADKASQMSPYINCEQECGEVSTQLCDRGHTSLPVGQQDHESPEDGHVESIHVPCALV